MISLTNVSILRGQQLLLEDASVTFYEGQRVGVIGRNGSGKTSLFTALAGDLALEQGEIKKPSDMRLSVMSQETPGVDRSALEFVIDADVRYREVEAALTRAEETGDDERLVALHGELELIDGYDIRHRAERLLSGLGFATVQFASPVREFSGGWRVRLNLAAALMCPSDLLLLDEPTNHLDLEATVWLEQWLLRYPGTLLLISHDRTFLDRVIDHVLSFENRDLTYYRGNYSAFEKQRAERLAQQQSMHEKQERRRAQIEDFVRRFRYQANKAKQAQSRLKELNRMQEIAPAHADSPFQFSFPGVGKLPGFLVQTEDLAIGFDHPLVTAINLAIRSDSRIGLLGYNGSGKSTLLKTLAGDLAVKAGKINNAGKLRIGYFAQHQIDALDSDSTPLKTLLKASDDPVAVKEQEIRNYLGGFDFRGDRVTEPVANFSGGEKARLALARVAWQRPNLLLLDEPTNHLDLEMVHALTIALQEFEGAIVLVSHDRHLLANTADEFYSIHRGRFTAFDGTLSDYESWLRRNQETGDDSAPAPGQSAPDKKQQRQDAAARREELAPLRKQEQQLEREMGKLQQALDAVDARLADPTLYEEAEKERLTRLLQEQGHLKTELKDREERWFEIQHKLTGSG